MKINNINIQTTYSTYLLDSNYKDLICFSPLKKLSSNDWDEYYGKEYDTDSPKLDTIQITLSFFSEANQYEPFINFLTTQTYNTFHFEELNKTFQLRLVSVKKSQKRTNIHQLRYYFCFRFSFGRLYLYRPQCYITHFRLHYRRHRYIQIRHLPT